MSRDPQVTYFVKTHEAPPDSQPAIYIVRNGLAAVRSYKHYLSDVNRLEYSLDQVVLGQPLFGSWGSHLDAWNPLNRPRTLVLKYEDLIHSPDRELDRVQSFLRLPRLRKWTNNFDKLHAANPRMFRQGPGVAAGYGFTEPQLQLFSALHGDWMSRLGYARPVFMTPRELRKLFSPRPCEAPASRRPKLLPSHRWHDLIRLLRPPGDIPPVACN
jgi:hypothetical protein